MQQENITNLIDFFHQAGKLKKVKRFSEAKNELKDSASDHCWRVSLIAMMLFDELNLDLDKTKILELAIIHDIVEIDVGNIDYVLRAQGEVTAQEQKSKEIQAIDKLSSLLPNMLGDKINTLWQEYDKSETREAKFVKAINKLETLAHIIETGYKVFEKPELIPNYADNAVNDFPELKNSLKILKQDLKAEFIKGGIEWKSEYEMD